jgi:signal transduction histidine kinase
MYEEENVLLQRLAQGETIAQFETVRVAKDARRVDVSLMLSPVRDGQGRVIGVSSVARDISYRKQMEERSRKEDRLKNEFIAMLGHELRNPLAPIRSGVEFLRRTLEAGTGSGQVCEMIGRQVAHMSRLLDDLLDVTCITRGEIRLQAEIIDVRTVVQRAVEASRPLLELHRHDLQVRLPQGDLSVHGDAVRLVQMMTNLLNNATHYTPDGGRIEVSVEGRSDQIEIRVKDNGVGLAADLRDCIFDLFVRGPVPQHGSREGLGIGLSLVRMIAQHHHGTVEARSAGPGTGSEFVVTLHRHASTACLAVDAIATPQRAPVSASCWSPTTRMPLRRSPCCCG